MALSVDGEYHFDCVFIFCVLQTQPATQTTQDFVMFTFPREGQIPMTLCVCFGLLVLCLEDSEPSELHFLTLMVAKLEYSL